MKYSELTPPPRFDKVFWDAVGRMDKEIPDMAKKEAWCEPCLDWVNPIRRVWTTSIAIMIDILCPRCKEILDRQHICKADL